MLSLIAVAAFTFCSEIPAADRARVTPGQGATNQIPKPPPPQKQTAGPFHGRLKAVDLAAGSITMGSRTFFVVNSTKIMRHGRPAVLKDGVVGEPVSGYFKTTESGRLVLGSLRFGPKIPEEESANQQKPGRN